MLGGGCNRTCGGGKDGNSLDGVVISLNKLLPFKGLQALPPEGPPEFSPTGTDFSCGVNHRALADCFPLGRDVFDKTAEQRDRERQAGSRLPAVNFESQVRALMDPFRTAHNTKPPTDLFVTSDHNLSSVPLPCV